MTARGLWKLRMMLRAKPRDSTNANSSKMMNLMARSASIKQSDDMIALSSGKRLHDVFGGKKTFEHSIFIPKHEPVT
jgi:hypothetical protein